MPAVDEQRLVAQRPVVQVVADVRALHRAVREVAVEAARERVAAALRDGVQRRAAGTGFGAHAARLELQFLDVALIGDVADARRGVDEVLVAEAVEVGARAGFAVIEGVVALRRPGVARAADVGLRRREARRHVRQRLQADVAARQRFELAGVQRLLLAHALRVDDRRRAGDGDGFFERRRPACDTFTVAVKPAPRSMPSRLTVEKPSREKVTCRCRAGGRRWCSDPRRRSVDRADFFDEGGTGGFDGHAGHRQA